MITIISAKKFATKLKATMQVTGRMGFTDETVKQLGITENSFIKFAQDDDTDKTLYISVLNVPDSDAFKVCKAGKYYYLPTKMLFDSMEMDYKTKTIIFDLLRAEELDAELGGQAYKLNKRELQRKQNNDTTE